MASKYRYLFGPVPSRRLRRSLGVDLTPYKTCCYDCVFCQLGPTTVKTTDRKEYVPTEAVLEELKLWLSSGGQADYITLSGSGEPTLHARFGEVLEFVRANTDIPAALLTNGALLHLPEVRAAAAAAEVVKVSLSAWDQASFEWVNRPHPQLRFDQMIAGQKKFRAQFNGRIWMEVFLIAGMNSMPEDVRKIAALAGDIAPDRIQLNTAVRPPSEDFVTPLSEKHLSALTRLFEPEAEIIAEFSAEGQKRIQANQDTILAMLRRRPCTAQQIADGFDLHLNEVLKYLGKLLRSGAIRTERKNDDVYYIALS
jgi:wyosine [tRNA(Phe)-imidazoG37] synthetase (radical SAM superfamily)